MTQPDPPQPDSPPAAGRALLIRACQNDRDHAGGDWCPGWVEFFPQAPQGRCDTCGAWYGLRGIADPACPRQEGWIPLDPLWCRVHISH